MIVALSSILLFHSQKTPNTNLSRLLVFNSGTNRPELSQEMDSLLLVVFLALILTTQASFSNRGLGLCDPPPPQPRGRRSSSCSLDQPPSLLSVEVEIECQGDERRLQGHIDSGAQGESYHFYTSRVNFRISWRLRPHLPANSPFIHLSDRNDLVCCSAAVSHSPH